MVLKKFLLIYNMALLYNKKKNIFECWRIAVLGCLLLSMFIISAVPARAGYWGEPIAAALMKQTMEVIRRSIEGELLGALKVAGVLHQIILVEMEEGIIPHIWNLSEGKS